MSSLSLQRYETNPFLELMTIPMKGKRIQVSRLGRDDNVLVNQNTGEKFGTHVTTFKRVDSEYLAAERPVLERDGMLMMIDDNRIDLQPGEVIKKRMVRFRTLGCWPLTGAVESNAQTLPEIIEEMLVSTTSERQGRVIDRDQAGSMELKKRQGYF